jgi:hypothetical protein
MMETERAAKAGGEGETQVIQLKCLACGLHFKVYSFFANWPEGAAELHPGNKQEGPFCPECGQNERFLIERETSEKFIFQHVGFTGENATIWSRPIK